jgi:hypothetical protein
LERYRIVHRLDRKDSMTGNLIGVGKVREEEPGKNHTAETAYLGCLDARDCLHSAAARCVT